MYTYLKLAFLVSLLTLSGVSGYLKGYVEGYDTGERIGKLDAQFNFKHIIGAIKSCNYPK